MSNLNPNAPAWTPTSGRPPTIESRSGRVTLRAIDFANIAWCMDACQGIEGPVEIGALKAVTESLEAARRELESISQVRNGAFYRNPQMDAAIAMVRGDDPDRRAPEPIPDPREENDRQLRQCREALDVILSRHPELQSATFGEDRETIGNLRAALGTHREATT
ncbi:hypothetical protein [Thioalkalivibrio sp. ALE19]|uniref:hypothetical protein n=1 Tax=Thioalkalivibrio sp. ALE19 TaxID=1266909 RepID=UPI000416CD27|nr:hypothetical protein [Thioalkalivibrio sp. ALE19]